MRSFTFLRCRITTLSVPRVIQAAACIMDKKWHRDLFYGCIPYWTEGLKKNTKAPDMKKRSGQVSEFELDASWMCYPCNSLAWAVMLLVDMACTVNLHIPTSPVLWPACTRTPHYTTQHTSTGLSYALNFQAGLTSQIPGCASRLLKESPPRVKDEECLFQELM